MKKLILIFAAIAITAGAYAQAGSAIRIMSPRDRYNSQKEDLQNKPIEKSHPDGVIMQNGKMMKVQNGKMTNLDNDITMSNGTKVMSDGTYIKKDGTKMTLKEGQHIDMQGKIIFIKTDKDKNMHHVPDSTRNKDF